MKKIILTTNLLFHIALGLNIAIFPVILKNNGVGEFFMGISGMVELSICLLYTSPSPRDTG